MKKGVQVDALKDISYTFPETGMIFIVGKSGSGKSTLLNILGLLDTYDSGEFLINGKNSKSLTESEKDEFHAVNIGFIFQEFHIIDKYTVAQNISLPLEIQKQQNNEKLVANALKTIGLEGYENRNPSELSGGQKQRVAIARAIIKNPTILLADEPTGSLDSVTGSEIFNILQKLSKEKLVIVISHDLDSAHKYADKIIELKDGLIDAVYDGDGGAEEVKFSVNTIKEKDINKYNEVLKSGKKVVISKPAKKPTNKKPAEMAAKKDVIAQDVQLPFNSMVKLSFASIKSKWVRTLLTVLVSVFAIAFFGFADLLATYNSNNLLMQEINRESPNYVNVAVQKVNDYGFYKSYDSSDFQTPQIENFNTLGLSAYATRPFLHVPQLMTRKNFGLLKGNHEYYLNYVHSYTENSDNNDLKLKYIAGRAPNLDSGESHVIEIAINSYHMQCFKLMGFHNGDVSYASVTNFEQIKDQKIEYVYTGLQEILYLKIVGLVEIDLSMYEPISSITLPKTSLTSQEKEALYVFRSNLLEVNTIYVPYGFHEKLEELTASRKLRQVLLSFNDNSAKGTDYNVLLINENIFKGGIELSSEIKNMGDIKDNHVIINRQHAERLLPDGAQMSDILGQTIHLTAEAMAHWHTKIKEIDKQLIVIGLYSYPDGVLFMNKNIVKELYYDLTHSYKVPVSSNSQIENVLLKINNHSEYEANEEVFSLYCKTSNFYSIRQIDLYFGLFVNIFSILSIILCIFSVILTYTFISQSIILRKKDIGILRSLGARKKDVAGIFVIEGAFIAIVEIVLAIIACAIGYFFIDYYFISKLGSIAQMYDIVTFGMRQILLMSIVTIVAVSIAIFTPIYRISNKQPVDAIRN